jgi:hypothetical protein
MHGKAIVTGSPQLDRFLATDPRDVDCEQALQLLYIYIELVYDYAPGLAARYHPGVAAHLAACGPCGDDFQGLLAAAGAIS